MHLPKGCFPQSPPPPTHTHAPGITHYNLSFYHQLNYKVLLYSLILSDCSEGGAVKVKDLFSQWSELIISLDIWHYMRRFAVGCTTEFHPLYAVFLGHLSQCIFEWSNADLQLLKHAKCCELKRSGVTDPSDKDVIRHISKKELAIHCRRKTCGVEETTQLNHDLLETF